MIETILVIVLVSACTIWYMRRAWLKHARILKRQHCVELGILCERYARGEINREEYLEKRSDILGFPLLS
jgi:uncharacterized membrane protein